MNVVTFYSDYQVELKTNFDSIIASVIKFIFKGY